MILKIDAQWDAIPSRMVKIFYGLKRLFAAITRARNGGIRFLWNVRVYLPEHMADTFEKVAKSSVSSNGCITQGGR